MKTITTLIGFSLMTVIGAGAIWYRPKQVVPPVSQDPIICTMEVKLCPDGSYVGRSGPGCAFALCPKASIDVPVSGNSAALHQTVTVNKVQITPLGSIEDSRCPAQVQCIQAGTVKVSVRLESNGGIQVMPMSIGIPVLFLDKKVTLVSVVPIAKIASKNGAGSEYRFTFSVTNRVSVPPLSTGRLEGVMTIGPICPVETVDNPCTPSTEEYASRKVAVYTADHTTLLSVLTPDSRGHFSAILPVGTYYVDMSAGMVTIPKFGIGAISGVPVTITLKKGQTYTLTINIDTGIRVPIGASGVR